MIASRDGTGNLQSAGRHGMSLRLLSHPSQLAASLSATSCIRSSSSTSWYPQRPKAHSICRAW